MHSKNVCKSNPFSYLKHCVLGKNETSCFTALSDPSHILPVIPDSLTMWVGTHFLRTDPWVKNIFPHANPPPQETITDKSEGVPGTPSTRHRVSGVPTQPRGGRHGDSSIPGSWPFPVGAKLVLCGLDQNGLGGGHRGWRVNPPKVRSHKNRTPSKSLPPNPSKPILCKNSKS